jgi:hypothetical protein
VEVNEELLLGDNKEGFNQQKEEGGRKGKNRGRVADCDG